MCGIIGYIGSRPAAPILLEGLRALEYRGYDSAGIAVLGPGGDVVAQKASGKLSALVASMEGGLPVGSIGIGHTRWATHGHPNQVNAHPHLDCRGDVVVAHNGIVENYRELRHWLLEQGHTFTSQTDSEVIPHLVESLLNQGASLEEAVQETAQRIRGAHAVVVLSRAQPDRVIAFRLGNAGGLTVGYGEGEMLVASDLPAILPHTRRVTFLAGGEMAIIEAQGARYTSVKGHPLAKEAQTLPYDPVSAAKGGYKHFMLKEIAEQPDAVMNVLRGRVSFEPAQVDLGEIPLSPQELRELNRVVFVGMGTSLHAAHVGRAMMEALARLPAEVDNAAEFRYRDPVVDSHTLVVSVGQSGETADTLAAMEEAARKGARQITICNAEGSQATRLAEGTIHMRAGPEIGVASTKTFACSLVCLYLLAIHVARVRGTLSTSRLEEMVTELASLPQLLGGLVADQAPCEQLASLYFKRSNFLYLGRGAHYPIAMEGALKLKEISYIHAEGCPAGEMKHGPIALIDENIPVVVLAPRDHLYDKMMGNISEVKARGGLVIALGTQGDEELQERADHVLSIPRASAFLSPILATVPLQLLAYHIAVRRGCDVDQPRNLAKSVTVE